MAAHIPNGISLAKLKKLLVQLGGSVETIAGTGEVRFRHPLMAKPSARINNRRKDAPRHAVNYVREVADLVEQRKPGEAA